MLLWKVANTVRYLSFVSLFSIKSTFPFLRNSNPYEDDTSEGRIVSDVVKNGGDFVHEFNIGTAAMHANHQKEMMMMMEHGALEADKINMDMMEMDMGNGMTMKHDDPNSVLLEPGKSAEVIWTFPKKAELEFACNVPGHYESGMVGKVRLQ